VSSTSADQSDQSKAELLLRVTYSATIVQEKRLPINPAWNANQLFCAASAFAVIVLGRDHYLDAMALPSKDSTTQELHGKAKISSTSVHLIQEHLEWLCSRIFDLLDCLEAIQNSTNNRMALLCLQMLRGMCQLDEHLQEASKIRYRATAPPCQAIEGGVQAEEMQNLIDLVFQNCEKTTFASDPTNF